MSNPRAFKQNQTRKERAAAKAAAPAAKALPAERLLRYDNLRAVVMFFVVLNNFFLLDLTNRMGEQAEFFAEHQAVSAFLGMAESLTLPLFVFFAGYFGKRYLQSSERLYRRLVNVFTVFVFTRIITVISASIVAKGFAYQYMGADFFMLAMGLWLLIAWPFRKYRGTPVLTVVLLVSCFLTLVPYEKVEDQLLVLKFVYMLPFFFAGVYWKEDFLRKLSLKMQKWLGCGGLVLLLVLFYFLPKEFYAQYIGSEESRAFLDPYFDYWQPLIRLGLYGLQFLCCLCAVLAIPTRKVPILTTIGQRSMQIYVLHIPPMLFFVNLGVGEAMGLETMPVTSFAWICLGISLGVVLLLHLKAFGLLLLPVLKCARWLEVKLKELDSKLRSAEYQI
ncbi:MAG: acyltransferase [Oscillospiraceae bacterium]|nr:acyltransferase [Oscillospiraceae bacterium]